MTINRLSQKEIKQQAHSIDNLKYLKTILDAFSDIIVIVNQQRQVIFANEMFLKYLGKENMQEALGERPGELIKCVHSRKGPDGCGTGKECLYCGAVLTVLKSQASNSQQENEARITTEVNGKILPLDLKVIAKPITIKNETYTMAILKDISSMKRKEMMERAFIHDLTNTVYSLTNKLDLFPVEKFPEIDEQYQLIRNLAIKVSDEIEAQKDIIKIERGELKPQFINVKTKAIIQSAINVLSPTKKNSDFKIKIDKNTVDSRIKTDPRLLQRVLINLLKNAIEASSKGDEIIIGSREINDKVEFWVRNNAILSDEIKAQIFQRSFSTKGIGRGIGTFSVKLLTEEYLHGKALFESNEKTGTIFRIQIPKISN